jgi:hypothetical protein
MSEWRGHEASELLGQLATTGLNRAAEYLMQQSQELAPEDTEALEESAQTHKTNPEELASQVQYLKYYAVWQHEKLNYHHKHGQAKFLEKPLVEHARDISNIVASEIEKGL